MRKPHQERFFMRKPYQERFFRTRSIFIAAWEGTGRDAAGPDAGARSNVAPTVLQGNRSTGIPRS